MGRGRERKKEERRKVYMKLFMFFGYIIYRELGEVGRENEYITGFYGFLLCVMCWR